MDAKRLGHKPLSAQEVFRGLPAATKERLKRIRGNSPDQVAMPSYYDDDHEGLKGLIEDLPKGQLIDVLKQLDDDSVRVIVYRALKYPPADLLKICSNQDGTSQPRDVPWLIRDLLGLNYNPRRIQEAGFQKIRILLEQLGFVIVEVEDQTRNRLGKDANPGTTGSVILRRLFEPGE